MMISDRNERPRVRFTLGRWGKPKGLIVDLDPKLNSGVRGVHVHVGDLVAAALALPGQIFRRAYRDVSDDLWLELERITTPAGAPEAWASEIVTDHAARSRWPEGYSFSVATGADGLTLKVVGNGAMTHRTLSPQDLLAFYSSKSAKNVTRWVDVLSESARGHAGAMQISRHFAEPA